MANDFSICVGTVGEGIWSSPDGGKTWDRRWKNWPGPGENEVRALAFDPNNLRRLYAGSDVGIYRSENGGLNWEKLESPMDGKQIWSVAVHPDDPNHILAGTTPPGLFRTKDGGKSWERLPVSDDIAQMCFAGAPKVSAIAFDPRDSRTVWMTVEIDGVWKSLDGGDTWVQMSPLTSKSGGDEKLMKTLAQFGITDMSEIYQDVHDIAICPGNPTRVTVTCPAGIFTTTDEGESWDLHQFPLFRDKDFISYCRVIMVKPDDPNVVFVGNGDSIPGDIGTIQRTADGGKTWAPVKLPGKINSHIYWMASHPTDPNRVVANSLYGQIFISEDGGKSWEKSEQEFGEVRAIAWVPN